MLLWQEYEKTSIPIPFCETSFLHILLLHELVKEMALPKTPVILFFLITFPLHPRNSIPLSLLPTISFPSIIFPVELYASNP